MTYNFVIYNTETMEKVGEVRTNHYISLDEAIELLDPVRLEKVDDGPDYMIDGKEIWYSDLDILLDGEYEREAFCAKFNGLLDKCVVPNASGRNCFTLSRLSDEDIQWMAEACPSWDWLTDVTDDGGNNLYDIAAEKGYAERRDD